MLVMDLLATPERWTQGKYMNIATGAYCLEGARVDCANRDMEVDEAMMAEAKTRGYQNHLYFNDDPNRTHAEILEFLEAVAKRLGRRF